MKKILLILSMFQFVANAQIVNKFRDSTWFKSGVQFDGNVVFKSGAGSGKVWTSNSNGTGSWQTISSSGVSQGALNDSIARLDSSINAFGIKISNTIFPNGGKIIEDTTYEITHSDAGYLLYFPYETTVTHSIANPLIESDVIGVQFYDPNSIITMDATLVELYLYSQLQSGDAEKGEVAIFQAIQDGEILPLFGLKTDESDGGKLKTITRYLYDKDTLSLGTGVTTYLAQTRAFQTLTDGATVTYNITNGYNAKVTLGGNRTLSITNAAAGDYGTLIVIQDGSGSKTLTLPAGSKVISGGAGAITLTTTANAIDVLSWFYDGTNYYWTYGKNYN